MTKEVRRSKQEGSRGRKEAEGKERKRAMAGALGLAGPGLMECSFVTNSKRTPIASSSAASSAASCVSCSASLSPYYNANLSVSGRPQKVLALRSSFTSRSMDSSFWDGGGVCNFNFFVWWHQIDFSLQLRSRKF